MGLGIDLGQAKLRLKLSRSLLKCGGHLTTRTTPRSPKINQYWNLAAADVPLETALVQSQ